MRRHLLDGTIVNVTPYSSGTCTIKVYDLHMNLLETVQRIVYRDMQNSDLYVNYGKCYRYVQELYNGVFRMIVDVETLPMNPKPLERAY